MIITVASAKGGVGKTTGAIGLASYLATRRGASPLAIVDTDKNRTLKSWADRSDYELPFEVFSEDELPSSWIGDLVIDTPGNIDDQELIELASGSDLVVLPTLPAAFSLEATIRALSQVGNLSNYRILLTCVPPKPSKAGERAIQAIDEAGLLRFKRTIARRVVYLESELEGVPVNMLPGSAAKAAWADYVAVGKELVKVVRDAK